MIKTQHFACLAMAGFALFLQTASAATITTQNTDLILGFRATSGQGAGVSLEVDLGAAANFYNAAAGSSFTLPGLKVQDLIDTYSTTGVGAISWNTRTNLFFGVIGDYNASISTLPVLTDLTLFASRGWVSSNLSVGVSHTTPWVRGSSLAQQNPVNKVDQLLSVGSSSPGALNGATSTANSSTAATIDGSLPGSYKALDGTGPSFGYFNPTIDKNTNIPVGGYNGLDLYQVIPNDDLGGTPSKFLGTITLSDTGVATFTAVPEPSTYALLGLGAAALFFARRSRKVNA